MSDWSDEETDEPLIADHRNFYKVEKWSRDGERVTELLFAGSSLDKAKRVFDPLGQAPATYPHDNPAADAGAEPVAITAALNIMTNPRRCADAPSTHVSLKESGADCFGWSPGGGRAVGDRNEH
jgi:hypothetical protein